jgi:phospholipid transport system substrate-binding protein
MKTWFVGCLALVLSISVFADNDPKAAVEPLNIMRDTFYQDVSKFQEGKLTEEELVVRISEQFAPLINDRTVALRVMGRFARQATEAERDRFTTRLESTLVDAYARGLASYGGEQLVLPEEGVILKPGRAMVEARLERSGREPLPIQFALGFEKDKGWMVENVVIAGINLGLTLRNQFADLVQSTGSVSGAIDSWSFESVSAN